MNSEETWWTKIGSWHSLKPNDPNITRCGIEVADEDEVLTALPSEWRKEKACETCLRLMATSTFGKGN